MRTLKFKVEGITSTRSGSYAVYKSESGIITYTANYGFKKGDNVEMHGYDGYAPERIDVNGKTVWTEIDRRNWWKDYDPKSQYLPNPYRKRII